MAGLEVPFPLKEAGDIAAAAKYGFCRDCPFPLHIQPHTLDFAAQKLRRELGAGSYTAHEIGGLVTLVATGTAPNLNTVVQLVQLPLMIWPPRFALYYTNPEIVMPAQHAFRVEANFQTHQRIDSLVVQDRDGIHDVPVENF